MTRALRQSTAALAVIRRQRDGRTEWLAQWNDRWQRYHFVGGHKHDDETFRQCMMREIGEELGMAAATGCAVAEQPLAHLDFVAWSEGAGEDTHYVIELFDVSLVGDAVELQAAAAPENRWLTDDHIRNGLAADGRPVSETMRRVLAEADLLPATNE
jgi:8-oxo-dGTP pyrophosphatase MutT (NUDIX family)